MYRWRPIQRRGVKNMGASLAGESETAPLGATYPSPWCNCSFVFKELGDRVREPPIVGVTYLPPHTPHYPAVSLSTTNPLCQKDWEDSSETYQGDRTFDLLLDF